MARCASLSFARFLASWSGVRLATPREVAGPVLRLLFGWPGDCGIVVSSVGGVASSSLGPAWDIGDLGSLSRSPSPIDRQSGVKRPNTETYASCLTILGDVDGKSHV
jgi:hypothetical protein